MKKRAPRRPFLIHMEDDDDDEDDVPLPIEPPVEWSVAQAARVTVPARTAAMNVTIWALRMRELRVGEEA